MQTEADSSLQAGYLHVLQKVPWGSFQTHVPAPPVCMAQNIQQSFFLPSVFEQLVGQKFGTEAAARALSAAGFLKCTKVAGYQHQKRVPSMNGESERKRFYAVLGRIRFT